MKIGKYGSLKKIIYKEGYIYEDGNVNYIFFVLF